MIEVENHIIFNRQSNKRDRRGNSEFTNYKKIWIHSYQIRLKELKEVPLSTKTICNALKRHGLNILECKIKNRKIQQKVCNEKTKSNGTDGYIGPILP
jgi:hypothetical protein